MEVNEKCEIVKYSKLVEGKAQKDIGASSTQEEMDNYQTVEISASTGIEENDDLFNVKPKQQKIGSKHLIGLSLAFLVIVSGLIAGLIVVSMSNHKLELQKQNLTLYSESKEKIAQDLKAQNENIFRDLENLTKALNASEVQIGSLKQDIQTLIGHNQKLMKALECKHENCSKELEWNTTLIEEDLNLQTQNLTKDLEKIDLSRELLKHIVPVENMQKILFTASKNGDIDKIKMALELGANVNLKDDNKRFPLYYSVKYGDRKVAKLLIQNGADVNAKDFLHQTPLEIAASFGKIKVAELLLQNGADVNAVNGPLNFTALFLAAGNGNPKMAQLLLENGANVSTKAYLGDMTPLHAVAYNNFDHPEIGEMLLNYGADINALDDRKRTPLHLAAVQGNLKAAKMLLKHGARKDLKDENGMTPLDVAKSLSYYSYPSDFTAMLKNN